MTRLSRWLIRIWPETLLALGITAFILYFGNLAFLRHASFQTGRFDLGIMDQTVWNTANGNFFKLIDPNASAGEVSRFSIHADTMLILFAPIYRIFPSVYVLLGAQVIGAGLGALGIFLLGKAVIKDRSLALLAALAYLAFPALQYAATWDFHAETMVTACLIFAFYFLYVRKYLWYAIFAALCLTGKETMALMVCMLGIYALWTRRDWRVGVGTILVSGAWFYLLLWHIMPASRGDGTSHFALSYYSQFGSSPGEIVKNFVTKPSIALGDLFQAGQARYLFYFLLPTGFLILAAPLIFLIALPELLLNMLSNDPAMHAITYQYAGSITPFAFIALVFGLARARGWLTRFKYGDASLAALLVVCIGISTYLWAPLPGMRWQAKRPNDPIPSWGSYLDSFSASLPKDALISVTDHLAPHFSERRFIYPFPEQLGTAEYLIIKDNDDNLGFPSWDAMQEQIRELRGDPRYVRVYHEGPIEVYRKTGP